MIITILKKGLLCYTISTVDTSFIAYKEIIMWTKPNAVEMRFGFEVTLYVMNK